MNGEKVKILWLTYGYKFVKPFQNVFTKCKAPQNIWLTTHKEDAFVPSLVVSNSM